MKKFFVTMLVSMMACVCTMAQLNIWYNGSIVYQRDYTLIDSITFNIQNVNPPQDVTENLPNKVEKMIGVPDNEIRATLQAEGYSIYREYVNDEEELFLGFVNNNQDTIECCFRQSNLLTDVNAIMHFSSGASPLDVYKEWSATAYNFVSWQDWSGYIRELPKSDAQYFSGRTLFTSVLNNMSTANYVAEECTYDRDNYASLSFLKGSLVSRIEYNRVYRHLDIVPVAINLPDTLYVHPSEQLEIPYKVQPHGALLSYITATTDDPSIATVDGEWLVCKSVGKTVMHVTCGTIQKSVVIMCMYIPTGMCILGPATAIENPDLENISLALMGQGINEVTRDKRDGMYEKYVVLEAGKNFHFTMGQFKYGAQLEETDLVTDYDEIWGYKGLLAENVEMQVKKTALYHVIVDFNKDNALAKVGGAQVVIAEVKWGVRGGMNNWGWTAATVDPEIKAGATTLTWKWEGQELAAGGQFKFANSNAWKINLDDAEKVKAMTFINATSAHTGAFSSGGIEPNLMVEKTGKYDITLTYNLAGGDVANSYSIEVVLTEEYLLPTTMYIIGNDFGNWSWDDPGVVEMVPVHSHPGMFWAVRYMTTDTEFRFCTFKAWNGDFIGLKTNEGFITPGNDMVEKNGLYTIVVDMKEEKITITPAKIFGMGDCFGGWNESAHPFAIAEDGKASIVTAAEGNIRMYADINNPGNWWQSEFNIFDGKIVYRGEGGDQEAVPVGAGKTVVLDFNAGTGIISVTPGTAGY